MIRFTSVLALLMIAGLGRPAWSEESPVKGIVLGCTGKPVAGARVYVIQMDFMRPVEYKVWAETVTDERGEFEFEENVLKAGGRFMSSLPTVYAYKPGLAWGSRMLGMTGSSKMLTDTGLVVLRPGRSVSGRVLDLAGKPIPAATVRPWTIFQYDDDSFVVMGHEGLPFLVTNTDENGRFTLSDLPMGACFMVKVEAQGYGRTTFGPAWWEPNPMHVPKEGLEIVLGPESVVKGRVTSEKTGKAAAGLRVELESRRVGPVAKAFTDQKGEFVIRGLEAGEYTFGFLGVDGRCGQLAPAPPVRIGTAEVRENIWLVYREGVPDAEKR